MVKSLPNVVAGHVHPVAVLRHPAGWWCGLVTPRPEPKQTRVW